jgi:hypothetical protein
MKIFLAGLDQKHKKKPPGLPAVFKNQDVLFRNVLKLSTAAGA